MTPKPLPVQPQVVLSPEILARLNNLPDRMPGNHGFTFTPEEDQVILLGWKKKRQADIARLVGHSIALCRRRYEELTEKPIKGVRRIIHFPVGRSGHAACKEECKIIDFKRSSARNLDVRRKV